jgi:hypothetical protein
MIHTIAGCIVPGTWGTGHFDATRSCVFWLDGLACLIVKFDNLLFSIVEVEGNVGCLRSILLVNNYKSIIAFRKFVR